MFNSDLKKAARNLAAAVVVFAAATVVMLAVEANRDALRLVPVNDMAKYLFYANAPLAIVFAILQAFVLSSRVSKIFKLLPILPILVFIGFGIYWMVETGKVLDNRFQRALLDDASFGLLIASEVTHGLFIVGLCGLVFVAVKSATRNGFYELIN